MGNNDGASLGQAVHDAYDKRDFSTPEASIADDFIWTVVPFGSPGSAGVAGYREVMGAWSSAFQDSTATPTAVIDGGDQAAIEFIFTGTHTAPLPTPTGEIAATGRTVNVPVVNIWRARNGKLVECRTYFDAATMLRQLGLLT